VATLTFTPTLRENVAGFLTVQTGAGTTRRVVAGNRGASRSSPITTARSCGATPTRAARAFWEDAERAAVPGLGVERERDLVRDGQAFYFSAEYPPFNRDNTGFVTDLYNTFFNRRRIAADSLLAANLNRGMPREVALPSSCSRPSSGTSPGVFGNTVARARSIAVTDFYPRLARPPARRRRLQLLGGQVPHGAVPRNRSAAAAAITAQVEAILRALRGQPEYWAAARTNAQYVGDLYNAFLRRGGDAAGRAVLDREARERSAHPRTRCASSSATAPNVQARVAAISRKGAPEALPA
jgi:hypothetical protein